MLRIVRKCLYPANKVPVPPSPPSLDTAAASSAAVQVPIGARKIGTSMPKRSQRDALTGFRAASWTECSAIQAIGRCRHAVADVSMLRFFLFASIVEQPLAYRLDQNEIGDAHRADGHEHEANLIQNRHGGPLSLRHSDNGDVADVVLKQSQFTSKRRTNVTPADCGRNASTRSFRNASIGGGKAPRWVRSDRFTSRTMSASGILRSLGARRTIAHDCGLTARMPNSSGASTCRKFVPIRACCRDCRNIFSPTNMTPVQLAADEVLCLAGDGCYPVEDGLLKVMMVSRSGTERAVVNRGLLIGKLGSPGQRRLTGIIAGKTLKFVG
jgi:hypothetical protein